MKKTIYLFIFPLLLLTGLAFTNIDNRNEPAVKSNPKPLSAAESKAALKTWEATPSGIQFKKWEASPAGKKVYASEATIRKSIREFNPMEAVVTSLSLPVGSRLGFGIMVNTNGEDFILSFGVESNKEFELLRHLKVNDKIIIKSRGVSHAPKYAYPIIAGDYIEHKGKLLYKRFQRKGGC